MELYFIRHGQSSNNLLWKQARTDVGRSADPELTEYGQKQIKYVAKFLGEKQKRTTDPQNWDAHNVEGFGITHLYSSLMVRAMDTASAIGEAIGLQPVIWEDIHETGGVYSKDGESELPVGLPGKNRSNFEERYPHFVLPDSLGEEGWWNRPYESLEERQERAYRFTESLRKRHGDTDDRVAIVSHIGFYNYMVAALLDVPFDQHHRPFWFTMNNTGITRIALHTPRARTIVMYQNRVDFLPPELIT